MRIPSAAAVVLLLAAGVAVAQEKDNKAGEHEYAGEVCLWTAHEADRSVSMSYRGLVGRISVREELVDSAGGGFTWSVTPGPGAEDGVIGQSTLAGDALDELCGALLRAHDRARQQSDYDPDAAFRQLLEALEPTR